MKMTHTRLAVRLWLQGILLFVLRLSQDHTGFDPETGLAVSNVPGTVLAIALAACAAVELVLCLRLPKGKRSSWAVFGPPSGLALYLLLFGSLSLAGGGVLLAISNLGDIVTLACGVTAAAAGAGTLFHGRCMLRQETDLSVLPLLPALLFSVFFLLEVYLPQSRDPVLARLYLPVLAASLTACALSRISGFIRRDSSLQGFVFTSDMAVLTCLAAAADAVVRRDPGLTVLYFGTAVLLTAFAVMRRDEPLQEAPPAGEARG